MANTGCLTRGYKLSDKKVLPAVALNFQRNPDAPSTLGDGREPALALPPSAAATLSTVIVYAGPGSWKKAAFWDEYVVVVTNRGSSTLVVSGAELTSLMGRPTSPGDDPWKLERLGKSWWKTNGGEQTKTYLLLGTGTVGGAGIGLAGAISGGIFGPMTTAGSVAYGVGAATVLALPLVAIGTVGRNIHGKHQIGKEFSRRRLAFPLSLAPGQCVQGSLFFPITPAPRQLTLNSRSGGAPRDIVIDLAPLAGLHLPLTAAQLKPGDTTPTAPALGVSR